MNSTDLYYKKMTESPLARLIITLGIPTTISMLVTNIYNMADTYFVGTLGKSAQAATGVLFTLQAIIQAIAFMLGQGSGTMVSKALADKNKDEAGEYVSTGFFTGILFGTVMSIVCFCNLDSLLYLLGSTETILPYARQYGACVLATTPIMIGSFVLNNNLRYEGMAFYSMIGLVSGGLLNILGDWLMVDNEYFLKLGVLGAGIATAISQVISFCILLYFHHTRAQGQISLKYISRKLSIYKQICTIGFPALIRQGLSSLSGGILNNIARSFDNVADAAIAAMSVANRASAFIMCVGLGVGQGYQPVASFNYQAKKYDRVKRGLLITMGIGFCLIIMLVIPGIIFAPQIAFAFQKDADVIKIAVPAIRYACIGTTFLCLSVPVNMLYQSIRKPAMSSFLSLLRSGLMLIPVLYLTTYMFGLTGLQISQPLADVLTGLVSVPFIIAFLRKKDENMD